MYPIIRGKKFLDTKARQIRTKDVATFCVKKNFVNLWKFDFPIRYASYIPADSQSGNSIAEVA